MLAKEIHGNINIGKKTNVKNSKIKPETIHQYDLTIHYTEI